MVDNIFIIPSHSTLKLPVKRFLTGRFCLDTCREQVANEWGRGIMKAFQSQLSQF